MMSIGHAEVSMRRYFFGILDDKGEIFEIIEVREDFVQFTCDFSNSATNVDHDPEEDISSPRFRSVKIEQTVRATFHNGSEEIEACLVPKKKR